MKCDKDLTLKKSNCKIDNASSVDITARASEIFFLYLRYKVKFPLGYIFNFGKNRSKKSKSANPIKYAPFKENKNLCVCNHIDLYLEKNKEW